MNKNVIPRQFFSIYGSILIDTEANAARPGDVLHVTKNLSGYLCYNKRTCKYFYIAPSILRDADAFKITEIIK